MKRLVSVLVVGLVCTGLAMAQQPNTPGYADFQVNGFGSSGPYPFQAGLPQGSNQGVYLNGLPNAPFYMFAAPTASPVGFPALGGRVDVNLNSGWAVVFDGLTDPTARLDGTGIFSASLFLPSSATVGSSAAFQTIFADPTNAPYGARLSACCVATVTVGVSTTTLSFAGVEPGRPGTVFNLSSYSLALPFYSGNYSSIRVNSDGFVSFGGDAADYTPTPEEFRTGPARAAPMWTDFDPGYAGASVTVSVDPIGSLLTSQLPGIRVRWTQMAEWSNSGSRHSFYMDIDAVGDITMVHDPFNNAMVYDQLTGITPGMSLLPPTPNNQWSAQKDLSIMANNTITGLPNEAFWEWYGLNNGSMPYYTAGFNNPWDLAGRTIRFYAIGVGSTGAYYIGS